MTTRRDFLTVSVVGGAAAALGVSRAGAAPKSMAVARESSFIKPFDDYFSQKLAAEYEKQTGIKITYEAVSVGGMLTRLTTIAETKSGPEIVGTGVNWPWLFDQSLVDVSDIATEIGKKIGPWHDNVLDAVVVNKKWKALPWGNIGQLEVYRTDWFKEAGVNKFPDNWEDLLAAGRLLKKKGHPFGFELGHGFGDNHGWLYPLLWSYGGREVDRDGKTVLIDSDETAKAVDFCRRFYKETMFEDVLGWTDVDDNKAFFFGKQISCTNNASSRSSSSASRPCRNHQGHQPRAQPTGAQGPIPPWSAQCHAIMTHAQNGRGEGLPPLAVRRRRLSRSLASSNACCRRSSRATTTTRCGTRSPATCHKDELKTTRLHGWPGPQGHTTCAESVAKYIIINMFAKAYQGT